MKITSMEEYGLRCLVQIARVASGDRLVSAQDIADSEGISLAYTQKILRVLHRGELVRSVRGAAGGYELARGVDDIALGDAIRVLGGALELEHICERHTGEQDVCRHASECSIRPVWGSLSSFVMRTFDAIPLSLLLESEQEVESTLSKMLPTTLSTHQAFVSCPLDEAEV